MNAGRFLIAGVVGAALVMQTGCSMAVKEARGASAKVLVIKDAKGLHTYRTVALRELKTDLGKQCPKAMLRTLERTFKERFELVEGSDASDARVLQIDAKVNYYQKGGGVKAVLGKRARCHVRLKLRGGRDDQLVADLLVPGASSAVMRAGHDDLAKAITKSVLKYLDKRGLRSPKSEEDDDEDSEDEEESTSVASNTDSAENDGE